MIIEYEKDYLQELYEKGKCKNKKYRFQPQVIQKYQKRIDTLMAATRIEDLFVFNSLNFEALDNDYYSIRIDYHYRLQFKLREEETEKILTICVISDITNHYQLNYGNKNTNPPWRCTKRRIGKPQNLAKKICRTHQRAIHPTQ